MDSGYFRVIMQQFPLPTSVDHVKFLDDSLPSTLSGKLTTQSISFELSHFRISSTDSKVNIMAQDCARMFSFKY